MNTDGSLLLSDGMVLDPESGRAERKDLLIKGGKIAAIGAPGTLDATTATRHHAHDRLIMPGLVNAHTHGHANLMKGVAEAWTLEASLTNGPWLAGTRDPDTIYLSTLLGAIDMLSKGCTACFDLFYEFPQPTKEGFTAAARAYADAGMRAVLAPMVADQSLFRSIPGLADALPPDLRETVGKFDLAGGERTIAAIGTIAAAQADLPDGVTMAIAPTIPHHCSERFLRDCLDVADRHELPIHMHIAESRLQAVVARKIYRRSALDYLADLGMLRPSFTAAHCVWVDEHDLDLLAEHGCSIAHIPASNFRLGSGIAQIKPMLERGINVGLATDGANSSELAEHAAGDAAGLVRRAGLCRTARELAESDRDRSARDARRRRRAGARGVRPGGAWRLRRSHAVRPRSCRFHPSDRSGQSVGDLRQFGRGHRRDGRRRLQGSRSQGDFGRHHRPARPRPRMRRQTGGDDR